MHKALVQIWERFISVQDSDDMTYAGINIPHTRNNITPIFLHETHTEYDSNIILCDRMVQ